MIKNDRKVHLLLHFSFCFSKEERVRGNIVAGSRYLLSELERMLIFYGLVNHKEKGNGLVNFDLGLAFLGIFFSWKLP